MHGQHGDMQAPTLTEVLSTEESAALAGTAIVAVDFGRLRTVEATWQENLQELVDLFATTELVTVEQEQWAADRMTEARAIEKDLEEDRKREVRPLIDEKENIDSAYKKSTKPLREFIEVIKKALAHAASARQRAQEALQLQAATLAAQGNDEACQTALAALPAPVKIAGASATEKWTFRLVDITKVRPELLVVDEKKLKALCKAHDTLNTAPTEPGFAFFKEAQVRATARGAK